MKNINYFEKREYSAEKYISLSINDIDIIELILKIGIKIKKKDIYKKYKKQISITGGFIRDKISKKKVNDYDITISSEIFEEVNTIIKNNQNNFFIKNYNCQILKVKNALGCKLVTFIYNKKKVDIKEVKGDFERDFLSRDFTINSIYYNIYNNKIIDYCDGMIDLKQNVVKCINDIDFTFKSSFSRFLRLVRFEHEGFVIQKELKKYCCDFFKMNKFKFEPFFYNSWKFQLRKIFLFDNSAGIIESMVRLKIFPYFYSQIPEILLNPHSFTGQFPIIYLSIINLIKKLDIFLEKKEKIKNLYNLNEKQFNDNVYLLKSHVIIYYFHHPIFQNNLQITQTKFQFDRIYVPSKFFFDIYNLNKHFNVNSFNQFDRHFKKMKFKNNFNFNYVLLTLLPIIEYYDLENIRRDDFMEEIKKYEINFYETNYVKKKH